MILSKEISQLGKSSSNSIANSNKDITTLQKYLHIERPIEAKLKSKIEEMLEEPGSKILLVIGNVGDGKSHLLSKVRAEYNLENVLVYNDATESIDPNKTAIDSLDEVIFSRVNEPNFKAIIAINIGILYSFYKSNKSDKLNKFLKEAKVFESLDTNIENDNFKVVDFNQYNSIIDFDEKINSSFISGVFEKICKNSDNNIFYKAYLEDKSSSITYENYKLLLNEGIRANIVKILVQTILTNRLTISAREVLSLVNDLINSGGTIHDILFNDDEKPNQIFNYTKKIDPILNFTLDEELNLIAKIQTGELSSDEIIKHRRLQFINDFEYSPEVEEFLKILYQSNSGKYDDNILDFSDKVFDVICKLNNHYNVSSNKIYYTSDYEKSKLFKSVDFEIVPNTPSKKTPNIIIKSSINGDDILELVIDYNLYNLITRIYDGYIMNKFDQTNAIQLIEFNNKVLSMLSNEKLEIEILDKQFKLSKNATGKWVLSR